MTDAEKPQITQMKEIFYTDLRSDIEYPSAKICVFYGLPFVR